MKYPTAWWTYWLWMHACMLVLWSQHWPETLFIAATPYCGEFFWEPTGEIKSPGFNLGIPYLPNSDCVWKISTDVNRTIALGLVENTFDIEEGSSIFTCNNDYLAVYDGENDQARRLGNFCGDAHGMRAFRTLHSSGRHLYLKFKSDGKTQKKGFHLRYQTFQKGKNSDKFVGWMYDIANKLAYAPDLHGATIVCPSIRVAHSYCNIILLCMACSMKS